MGIKNKSLGIEPAINICKRNMESTWEKLAKKIRIKSWYEIRTKGGW